MCGKLIVVLERLTRVKYNKTSWVDSNIQHKQCHLLLVLPNLNLQEKVSQWRDDVIRLSNFAYSQPHAAMIHGVSSRWAFLTKTVSDLCSPLRWLSVCTCYQSSPNDS